MTSEEHHTPLLKPLPRRPFELSSSNDSSAHSSPYIGSSSTLEETHLDPSTASTVSRSRSILNLTSSTLFGIYGPTAGSRAEDASQPPTPWGTGAETPIRERNGSVDEYLGRPSLDLSRVRTNNAGEIEKRLLEGSPQRRKARSPVSPAVPHHAPTSLSRTLAQAAVRVTVLFVFGVAYGALVAHLHDDRHIAPVEVRGFNRAGWGYLVFWGAAGVGIGSLLPWVDSTWDGLNSASQTEVDGTEDRGPRKRGLAGVEWSDVVRGVGAFVGIAFAIVSASLLSMLRGLSLRADAYEIVEKTGVVEYTATQPDPRARKSLPLVPPRSYVNRLYTEYFDRHDWHGGSVLRQPQCYSCTHFFGTLRQCHLC